MQIPAFVDRLIPPVEIEWPDGLPNPRRMRREEQLAVAGVGLLGFLMAIAAAALLPNATATARVLIVGVNAALFPLTIFVARKGHRFVASIVLMIAGVFGIGVFLGSIIFIAAHYGVGMWMILRQNKLVRDQAAVRRAQRQEAGGGTGARQPRERKPKVRKGEEPPPPVRTKAPPSKRYTPPKTKRKSRA